MLTGSPDNPLYLASCQDFALSHLALPCTSSHGAGRVRGQLLAFSLEHVEPNAGIWLRV